MRSNLSSTIAEIGVKQSQYGRLNGTVSENPVSKETFAEGQEHSRELLWSKLACFEENIMNADESLQLSKYEYLRF